MRYEVDNEIFYNIEDVLEYCIDDDYHYDDEGDLEEWINDRYGYINICGDDYSAYDILRTFEDSNWDYARDRYCEEKNEQDREDARYELERAEDKEEVEIQNHIVTVYKDDEDNNTGDFDGDTGYREKIEAVRQYYEDKKILSDIEAEAEKEVERDVMALFQTIGGK